MKPFDPKEFQENNPTHATILTIIAQVIVLVLQLTATAVIVTVLYLVWRWIIGVWI